VVNRSAGTRKLVGVAIGVAIALAVTVAVFLVPGTSGGAGDALVGQPFVKDSSKTIGDVLKDASEKFRERIAATRCIRWAVDDREHPEEPTPQRAPAVILSFKRTV
jgi:hypothetical protein